MLNPLTGTFEGPKGEKGNCRYKGSFGEGAYECRSSYIDTPTRLEFWVAVQDDPPGGPIPAATWAVLDRRAIAPDDTFVSMGNEDRLGGSPRQLDPLLQLAKTRLNFVAGREYFVNMWLCDVHQNCEMAWSMPLTLDMTPPPVPSVIIADHLTNTSANGLDYYFVKRTMILPAWNTQNGVGTSGGIRSPWNDPESGKVRTRWSVVKSVVGGEPKPVVRPRLANGDGYSTFGESHISSSILEHGATYFVQLLMQNSAGGVARTVSRPIKADFTKPVCASPRIYATCAAAGCVGANVKQNVVPSGVLPVSGTPYAGTRSFSWIGANLNSFIVDFNQTTCTDPESGFFALDFALGRFSGDASLLEKRRIMLRTTTTIQVDFSLGEGLMDSAECSGCGRPIHLNIWCTNGALQTMACLQMPRLRVDGSPPTCPGTGMRLGDGLHDGFQVGLATLRVRNMHEVRDAETGVRRVDYNLLDVNTSVSTALSQVSGVGLPSRDFDVTGVNLAHDHVYRISATVTNGIGNTVECSSSDVRVDTTPPVRGRVFVLQREAEAQLDTPSRHSFAGSARTMLLAQRGFHDPESALGEQYVGIFLADGTPIVEERRVPPIDWVGFNVALSHRVSYYASWRYENKAQLSTMAFSNVITVDLTPPTVIPCLDVIEDANLITLSGSAWWERVLPNDEVDYVGSTEFSLSVRFEGSDEDSGIAEAEWCIGTIPGACDAAPAGIIDHREMMATRSLVLQDMTIYYQSVQFMNRAGLFNMAASNGFMVDVSPPVCGQVLDGPAYDRAYIGPSSIEGLSWIIESGIQDQGSGSGEAASGIDFWETGTTSGLMSNDGALSDLAFAELEISWSDFADHGGGIAGYSVAIVPTALHGLANTSNARFVDVGIASPLGASARRGLLLAHNQMYYGVVSAYDLLGNEVKCYSNGVLVDFTPPNMTLAALRSLLAPAGAQSVQPLAHTIHVEVTGVDDPESGIVQYYAAMGNASGIEAVRPFRMAGTEQGEVLIGGLDLYDGLVDVTIRAVNGALEQADVTMTVGVDTGVPLCSAVVIGANAPGQAIQYTTDGTQVEARWNCSDVAPWADTALSCSWAVGTFPGGDDAMPWAAADSQGSHSWLNASLEDGRFYWVTVACTDHVGWQVSSVSGALVPDLLPPTVSVQPRIVTRLGRAASFWSSRDEIAAVWGFDDLVSGIQRIRASVSVDARVPPMSEMPLGLSTDPMVRHALIPLEDAGILLSHNTRYYLHVCAEDHANHSVCAESATVLVDLTPPVCEIPIDMAAGIVAPNITSLQMGVSGSWHCRDPESGVASSSWMPYAGTTSARGDALLGAPINIKGGAGSSTMAMRLASGNIYRGCVTSLNGAGLVSFVGGTCSSGMAYDGTAPRPIHKHISDLGGRAFLPAPSQLCTDWPSWCVHRSCSSQAVPRPPLLPQLCLCHSPRGRSIESLAAGRTRNRAWALSSGRSSRSTEATSYRRVLP